MISTHRYLENVVVSVSIQVHSNWEILEWFFGGQVCFVGKTIREHLEFALQTYANGQSTNGHPIKQYLSKSLPAEFARHPGHRLSHWPETSSRNLVDNV